MRLEQHWLDRVLTSGRSPYTTLDVSDSVQLSGTAPARVVPYAEVHSARVTRGTFWATLTLSTTSGEVAVHGLPRDGAQAALAAIQCGQTAYRASQFNQRVRSWIPRIQKAHQDWSRLASHSSYVTHHHFESWRSAAASLELPAEPEMPALDAENQQHASIIRDVRTTLEQGRTGVDAINEALVARHLQVHHAFLDHVEKNPLNDQQRLAVVHDEDNALVIAGAGSGKTSTIMAKVGYLLEAGLARPDEILLLAFTRKAAEEMRERIQDRYGRPFTVRTFHSLGREILAQAQGTMPSLAREAEDSWQMPPILSTILTSLLAHPGFRQVVLTFLSSHRVPYKSPFECKTPAEYYEYLRTMEIRSLTGDKVKSYEECEIANWLFANGVKFEYEAPYRVNTATATHRQYTPDFYLPDADVYIEHFALDERGNPPPYFDQKKYLEGVDWKRRTHQVNQTTLVETYSHEKRSGTLLKNLETRLRACGIELRPLPPERMLEEFNRAGYRDPLISLLATFLDLYRSSGLHEEEVRRVATTRDDRARCNAFLDFFFPVMQAYESDKTARGEIDFHDMIHRATAIVRQGQYASKFRYLLVDEFQDISHARARLVLALRDQVPDCRLFCVGDDWQSIYRFAGSDVSLMTRFSHHFGFTRKTKLDVTYRFNDRISATSSRFVLKNPAQISKILRTHRTVSAPAVFVHLVQGREQALPSILAEIEAGSPGGTSVFVLGRYKHSLPASGDRQTLERQFRRLRIQFLTTHSSKGLEADYVIVAGLKDGKHGFPSQMVDDPLLNLVLAHPDAHPHGEERRLFYVALTRARHAVHLVADAGSPSCFVNELLQEAEYGVAVHSPGGQQTSPPARCPECHGGMLLGRNGKNGFFFGCSYYPYCSYAEDSCAECHQGRMRQDGGTATCDACGHEIRMCPRCGLGRLVLRNSRYGRFLACTMYRSESSPCRYTQNLP